MSHKVEKMKWYESENVITTLIIATILVIIFCSQSFTISIDNSLSILSSILNHNSLYLVVLIYFVLLKLKVGKKYFNFLNVFLVFFYFISMVTSLLTLVQSFSLNTILGFFLDFVLFVYLLHTMFRDTSIWREFRLGKSPFNEISNDNYYYALVILVAIDLVVNLIFTVVVSGLFLSILDALFVLLFGRYIYLYREYLDYHHLDSDNNGSFQEIEEVIKDKIDDVLENTNVDEKIVDVSKKVKDKIDYVLEKTDLDEKISDTTKKVKKEVKKQVKRVKKVIDEKGDK